jgi:hypothetical protein
MSGSTYCPVGRGVGLVPAKGCTCGGTPHTCTPAVCTMCDGAGGRPIRRRRARSRATTSRQPMPALARGAGLHGS